MHLWSADAAAAGGAGRFGDRPPSSGAARGGSRGVVPKGGVDGGRRSATKMGGMASGRVNTHVTHTHAQAQAQAKAAAREEARARERERGAGRGLVEPARWPMPRAPSP